jgi:hypothetical protein
MRDMTEEEYDALDERLTKTVPTLGHTGTGFLHVRVLRLSTLMNTPQKCSTQKR